MASDGTHVKLWPVGWGSKEQAEQFSENWQGNIDGLTGDAETAGR